jgi:Skp family chaperone for outer membrane proteins
MEKSKEEELGNARMEIEKIRQQLQLSQRTNSTLAASLRRLSDIAKGLQRDYRAQARDVGKELAEYSTQIRSFFTGSLTTKIRVS